MDPRTVSQGLWKSFMEAVLDMRLCRRGGNGHERTLGVKTNTSQPTQHIGLWAGQSTTEEAAGKPGRAVGRGSWAPCQQGSFLNTLCPLLFVSSVQKTVLQRHS